jgi:hypothetical protein
MAAAILQACRQVLKLISASARNRRLSLRALAPAALPHSSSVLRSAGRLTSAWQMFSGGGHAAREPEERLLPIAVRPANLVEDKCRQMRIHGCIPAFVDLDHPQKQFRQQR